MKREFNVSLNQFVFSLSQALDLINHRVADYHKRVAYIALRVAEAIGLSCKNKEDVVIAAALHDIGALPSQTAGGGSLPAFSLRSARFGFQLLSKFKPFRESARIVRFHYVEWANGEHREMEGEAVPLGSHIVRLASRVDGLVDRDRPILWQAKAISEQIRGLSGDVLMPEIVDAFLRASANDAFWLDLNATDLLTLMAERMPFSTVELDIDGLQDFAELLGQMIDFRSRFTATHSGGVAATAATLAQLFGFPETDCKRIQVAGRLHDLGKLAIPVEYLEKNGKLAEDEWKIVRSHPYFTYRILAPIKGLEDIAHWGGMHHERLNGDGYPFASNTSGIPLEARILAVADIFTALTEDRPYRSGLGRDAVLDILGKLVDNYELDRKVVAVLVEHYADLDRARVAAQENALREYRSFMEGLAVLDLSGARSAHAVWKRRLRSYLDGQTRLTREEIVSHKHCDLGRWYYGEGLRHYSHIPELHELEKPHRALHDLMHALVEHKEQGRDQAAELCYAQVEPLSKRITGLLHAIERKAAQAVAQRSPAIHSDTDGERYALQRL